MHKKIETLKEYHKIVEEVRAHDKYYYEEFKPKISDYEYDQLIKLLEEYEKNNPDHIISNSPTQKVGETISKGFKQKEHIVPMLSLANTYSEEELKDFISRVYKLLERRDIEFCCELKMDGTAVSIRYENGKFKQALTRGNGKVGDDVTANIKTIKRLPLVLKGKNIPPVLEVRGEVFMHKRTFNDLNNIREEKGLEVWANPRNAAAGSLKLLDSREVARRKLDLICYGIAEGKENIQSQFYMHKFFHELNLPTSQEDHYAKCKDKDEIINFAHRIQKIRGELSFEIDGIVVKVDDISLNPILGERGKSPRYAVAYKFAPEQAFTQIEDITVQVGRTGVLTPVAELKDVKLAGSTISRATLHNQDEIDRKDIRINDWVVIEKGGDVIPKVVSVDLTKRKENSKKWHMPKKCPICNSDVIKREGEVAIRCPNTNCIGRRIRKIAFFVSKPALDIDHMGIKVVEQLVEKGLISKYSDIFSLDENMLSQLEGFKEKSVSNLLNSIEKAKKCSLARFILGLEIPYVGAETADLLAQFAKDIEALFESKKEDLLEIEGVGEKVADAVISYFHDPENIKEIKRLLTYITPTFKQKKYLDHEFNKKIFVLTGALEDYSRQEAAYLIKERGGKVSSSVSKNTDYVLAGEEPGSKYDKANKLHIPIMSEKEFKKRL